MATNFPGSADAFTNPTSGDTLDNPPHDQQHADINDAMEAVQTSLLDGAPLHIDDANERVGIGTASPDDPLHVVGDVTIEVTDDGSAAQPEVTLHRGSASPADGDYLGQVKFSGKNDAGQTVNYAKITGKISDVTDATEDGLIEIANIKDGSQSIGYRFTSSDLKLINGRGLEVDGDVTVDTDTLHVDTTNERVGIGTTSPAGTLDVNGKIHLGGGTNRYIEHRSGNNDILYSSDTGDFYRQDIANSSHQFFTGNIERVRIDSSGNVGIGTQSPGSLLDVRGGVQTHRILPFTDNTHDLGANVLRWDDVYATNGTIQTSDERDKASVADIDLGLAFVNDLRPVTYTWDDRSGNVGARTHMGFVAQEVATVLGDEASNRAVWIHASAEQTTDPETGEVDEGRDIQGLRYNELMAPMVKAIQELTARIEALENPPGGE